MGTEDKKRPAKIAGPALEAIGNIVIWEGNYRSDIYNIVIFFQNLNFFYSKTVKKLNFIPQSLSETDMSTARAMR
jgi:hypothetical protein